jgi:hypothetical protein
MKIEKNVFSIFGLRISISIQNRMKRTAVLISLHLIAHLCRILYSTHSSLNKQNFPCLSIVGAAYAPGSWLAPAWQKYYVLQHHCTLCTVPVYKPLCMQ